MLSITSKIKKEKIEEARRTYIAWFLAAISLWAGLMTAFQVYMWGRIDDCIEKIHDSEKEIGELEVHNEYIKKIYEKELENNKEDIKKIYNILESLKEK